MAREERGSRRIPVFRPVEYSLAPSIIEKRYEGILTDISDSGACLLTTVHLRERQRIIISDNSCLADQAAIVRWTQKYDDMLNKIGLEFIEEQTFMNIRDKRRYKRLNLEDLRIHGRTSSGTCVRLVDISFGGLLMETCNKWDINTEHTVQVECGGKQWSIKGSVVRSELRGWKNDNQNNSSPIYYTGMRLTGDLNEIQGLFKCIRLLQINGDNEDRGSGSKTCETSRSRC